METTVLCSDTLSTRINTTGPCCGRVTILPLATCSELGGKNKAAMATPAHIWSLCRRRRPAAVFTGHEVMAARLRLQEARVERKSLIVLVFNFSIYSGFKDARSCFMVKSQLQVKH